MRSTSLQDQSRLGRHLADCGVAGIGSIFWVLNRIFLTPRSVRIGLSGLLVWVGAMSVCLADPAPNPGQTWRVLGTPSGAIKDPFNPQGYMRELAGKMGSSKPGNAVLGAGSLSNTRPVASVPAPSSPTTTGVRWLTPANPAPTQPTTAQPIMSPPSWLSSTQQTEPKKATLEVPPGHVRWLSPGGGVTPTVVSPPSGKTLKMGLNAPRTTIHDPLPPAPVKSQLTWLPSGPAPTKAVATEPAKAPGQMPAVPAPTPKKLVDPAPPMEQAEWLSSDQSVAGANTSINAALPTKHATWLPTHKAVAPKPAVENPDWPAPDKHFARKAKPAAPAPDSTTWLSPENGAAQKALAKMAALKARKQQEATAPKYAVAVPASAPAAKLSPKVASKQPALPPRTAAPQMPLMPRTGTGSSAVGPLAGAVMYAAMDMSEAKHFFADPSEPKWSLGADLDKYRNHAVQEGSRHSGESLEKALGRIGLFVEDTTNVITLGYASDRALPFRKNDGKGLIDDPTRVPKQAGETVVSLGDGLYSIADLVTLNALPDHDKSVYQDNHPIVRPLVFTGRTIGGAWKTTEEIGNAITWGYFDNVTGSIGMCIEDLIELLKHTGQAVTNLARVPVQLITGENENADKTLDWVLLVPLEFASNVLEMKGITNMDDYKTAFEDKGVVGSILEFGGSTFLVYRALDELADELKDDKKRRRSSNNQSGDTTPEPTDPPVTPPDPPTPPTTGGTTWGEFILSDGQIWTGEIVR